MDNSKVNGVNTPPQAHTTATQPTRATQSATDRFARAMGDSAYRRWQEPSTSGLGASQFAFATESRATPAPSSASSGELTQMLERMCSALYVGEKSVGIQRVVMALDHVLPGAAAEIVREGVHLSIRLRARNEESFRSMSLQRDALVGCLSSCGDRRVEVSVIHGDEQSLGDSHG